MKKIDFLVRDPGHQYHDAAIVLADEDPRQALIDAAISSLSTDIELTLGEVTIHLAAIIDPEHWEEDWRAVGVEDAEEFIAGLVQETPGLLR